MPASGRGTTYDMQSALAARMELVRRAVGNCGASGRRSRLPHPQTPNQPPPRAPESPSPLPGLLRGLEHSPSLGEKLARVHHALSSRAGSARSTTSTTETPTICPPPEAVSGGTASGVDSPEPLPAIAHPQFRSMEVLGDKLARLRRAVDTSPISSARSQVGSPLRPTGLGASSTGAVEPCGDCTDWMVQCGHRSEPVSAVGCEACSGVDGEAHMPGKKTPGVYTLYILITLCAEPGKVQHTLDSIKSRL